VNDPALILGLMGRVQGVNKPSSLEQEHLSRLLKIILLGVAVSLLYSVEVGKVMNQQFGGIEPEEFRDLLMHDLQPTDSKQILNEHQQLTLSVVEHLHSELSLLPAADRAAVINHLLDYMGQVQEVNPLLDPAKTFQSVLSASLYSPDSKSVLRG
jgi:hypothetical protein